MRLLRYPDTQGLYNYLSAVSSPRSRTVVLERDRDTFTVGRIVNHHSGVPLGMVGFNISTYMFR